MNTRYPNLELLEYKARAALSRDEEFLKIFEEKKKNKKYVYAEIDLWCFRRFGGARVPGSMLLKTEALHGEAAR